MAKRNKIGFSIDPNPKRRKKSNHIFLNLFFLLLVGAVAACAVWFLGFSQYGFSWHGNTARLLTEPPEDVVTSYPSVHVTLDDVALLMEVNQNSSLKAHVHRKDDAPVYSATPLKMRWHSENPSVVKVDTNGIVSAMQPGTARVVVSVENADVHSDAAHCVVTVRDANSPLNTKPQKRYRRRR